MKNQQYIGKQIETTDIYLKGDENIHPFVVTKYVPVIDDAV